MALALEKGLLICALPLCSCLPQLWHYFSRTILVWDIIWYQWHAYLARGGIWKQSWSHWLQPRTSTSSCPWNKWGLPDVAGDRNSRYHGNWATELTISLHYRCVEEHLYQLSLVSLSTSVRPTKNARIVTNKISGSNYNNKKRDIIYIYEKVQMHSYSLKCQSDQHRLMVDTCLSMTFWFFFLFFFLFLYLNVHIFCAKHCCSIFLIFDVTWLAIFNQKKWHLSLCAPTCGVETEQRRNLIT